MCYKSTRSHLQGVSHLFLVGMATKWAGVPVYLLLVFTLACSSDPEVQRIVFEEMAPPPRGPLQVEPHRIQPGDIVTIKFTHNPELNVEVPVRQDGKISLSLVGEVPAAGLTLSELRRTISQQYKEFVDRTRYGELLKEGDELEFRYVYNPELNLSTRIRSDGKVSLPLVGDVEAAGRLPGVLRNEIVQKYAKAIKHPDIALLVGPAALKKVFADEAFIFLSLSKPADQTVFVGGEVRDPKVVRFDGQLTTWQAIMQAGGFTDKSDLSRVVILRRGLYERGEWIKTNLDVSLAGERFPNDIVLHQGDVVVVPKSGIAKWDLWVQQYIRDALPIQTYMSIFLIPYQANPQ
jgi:protein involved in polysaccharide export with SLBB domain